MMAYTETVRERLVRQINTAPEPLRSHIIAMETVADPTGDLRELVCLRETCAALLLWVGELKAGAQ